MIIEQTFNTGSVILNYMEGSSSGIPLVLLHGIPGRWQEFLPIIPALSLQWRIFALDFRGQGKSGRTPGQYHSKYYVDDVTIFLKNLGEPAFIFGQSAGGMVALKVAAQSPEIVHALVVGDSPIDIPWLLAWMNSDGFTQVFSALRSIAQRDQPPTELMKVLADIPISIPGKDTPICYADSPDVDKVHLLKLATILSYLDPGVLEYHAEGRAQEYLEGYDMNEILTMITCPVLLLQGNPSLGGMMTDQVVSEVLSRLPTTIHVLMEKAGHDLGLDTWEVAPLLSVVNSFLHSL